MKRWMIAAALLTMPGIAHAMTPRMTPRMTVAEFLGKANALKAKGVFALGSPDIKLLQSEVKAVAEAYRADLAAARSAGKLPHSCPPPKGKARIGSKEVLADFEAIPPAQRGMSVKAAFYAMMKRRYPCP